MSTAAGSSGTFPNTFRSTLELDNNASSSSPETLSGSMLVTVRCHCGDVILTNAIAIEIGSLLTCHCHRCRKAACAAFGAWVRMIINLEDEERQRTLGGDDSMPFQNNPFVASHEDSCSHFGRVVRYRCGRCHAVLGVLQTKKEEEEEENPGATPCEGTVWVALGAVEDASIPRAVAFHWQSMMEDRRRTIVCPTETASWKNVLPQQKEAPPNKHNEEDTNAILNDPIKGGCSCTSVQYEISSLHSSLEFQHCYCNLCRRMSGSAYQTWIPISKHLFRFTQHHDDDVLQLLRTTAHGQRHICRRCGSNLTIVYDSQPDVIWPAAGGLEDDDLPNSAKELSKRTSRVVHICCSMMPPWYRLPEDDLPRLKDVW